jgi:hypothetical protein
MRLAPVVPPRAGGRAAVCVAIAAAPRPQQFNEDLLECLCRAAAARARVQRGGRGGGRRPSAQRKAGRRRSASG